MFEVGIYAECLEAESRNSKPEQGISLRRYTQNPSNLCSRGFLNLYRTGEDVCGVWKVLAGS